MEAKLCDFETEAEPMDSDSPDLVGEESLDFDEWISLISRIEKTYPDNLEKICLVYDSFLSEFPLCHGYWRRYADHKIRLCAVDKVVEVFERAVRSATYSVSLWVDYCTFSMLVFEDPTDIRRLFRRGITYVCKDYLCHALWDLYIKFELSQEQWSFLANIYIEALRFPTKKLHRYHDGFKKLAELCNKDLECQSNCSGDSPLGSSLDNEVPKSYRGHDISSVVKDLFEPSTSLARSKKSLQKYLCIGEHLYHEASQVDEKISRFEAKIQRSYFHVKPLDVDQLENWHHYLDFIEVQGDFDWAVKLYERCLIPCANYPEFWMRYVEFMETKGGREIANHALDRATQVFLKRMPVIHLFNARFKEHQGDVIGAHSALLHCDAESDLKFVENVVIKANIERRLGNYVTACNIFEEALAMAAAKKQLHSLPSLYVHFSRLKHVITESSDAARDVLIDGIKQLTDSKLLLEELINFATLNGGKRHLQAVDSIIDSAISPRPDASQGLSDQDAEDVSSLYLKFVDLCGTIHEVRKAWNRHIRLFPHSIRTHLNVQLTTNVKSLELAKEGREDAVVTKPQQPSEDCSPDQLVQLPLKDQKMSTHDSSAHNLTNCRSGQIMMARDNPDIQFEQAPSNPERAHHSGESDHGARETVALPSIDVPEESRNDLAETVVPSVDLGSAKVTEQPREDASECRAAEGNNSEQALRHSKGNYFQQDYDHEPQQDMKPLSLDGISLHSQNSSSHDLNPSMPLPREAPREICNLGGSNVETCEQNNEDSLRTEIEAVNFSSSRSHQSPISTERPPHPHVPTNSSAEKRQLNDPDNVHRVSKFGPQRHLERKSHQQQQASPLHPWVGLGGPMPMNQGCSSQTASPDSPQIQHGSRAQHQYQATPPANPTPPPPPNTSWPLQNMQQPNYASLPQPTQGSGEHGMQNNQAYNQMWQYYYYQQQVFLQQQQQQQHLHPSQQYQHHQQLPFQQQYFQPQPYQQPQPHQQQYDPQLQQYLLQQQVYQPPQQHQLHQQYSQHQQQHQLYAQQAIQQVPQEQQPAEQRQYQQKNNRSQIQELGHSHFQLNASLDHNGTNQSAPERAADITASQDQVTTASPMLQRQSPVK